MALKNKTFRLIEEGLKFVQDYGGMIEQENFAEQLRLHDKRIIKINECTEQIQNMKSGSIALIKQITTVSKIRIVDPVKKDDVLSGIRLSAETLSALDNKIAKCFTKLNIDTK